MTECYVYGLRDKQSSLYFYIGSTKHLVEKRLQEHQYRSQSGQNKNAHFNRVASRIGWDNITIDVLVVCVSDNRFEIEYERIREFKASGHPLTNIIYVDNYTHYIQRQKDEYDEYVVTLDHIESMLNLRDNPQRLSDNDLIKAFQEVIIGIANHLIDKYPNDLLETVDTLSDDRTNSQAASIRKRILEILECD